MATQKSKSPQFRVIPGVHGGAHVELDRKTRAALADLVEEAVSSGLADKDPQFWRAFIRELRRPSVPPAAAPEPEESTKKKEDR